jgi:glycerol-1-phosphate dehydrogenase [NAD(P)+]
MRKTGQHEPHGTAELPSALEDLLGFETGCGCGRRHSVELRRASIRDGALEDAVDAVRGTGAGKRVLVVCDRVTREVAGERVADLLRSAGMTVAVLQVPDGAGDRPHATDENVELVEGALGSFDQAVAAGAGTINDLTKLATFKRGRPYVAVGTALSMNGYASAIAAVMSRGVKRTVPCHQPDAVLLDLSVLSRSPSELIAAGLGDLESKPTSTADFRLGALLRGAYHCPAPERVVLDAERRVADSAAGLPQRDPEAVAALAEALVLSGISMKLAGSSGPASGGEHLISHHWDMTAEEEGRIEGWHGAQVGVATIVCAALYELLRGLDPSRIDIDEVIAARPSREEIESGVRRRHGPRAAEVLAELRDKQLDENDHRRELELLLGDWERIWSRLDDALRPAKRVRRILLAGGAPTTVAELGLTARHLRDSFIAAREIRGRFTVLDLAWDLGLLEKLREPAIELAGSLG